MSSACASPSIDSHSAGTPVPRVRERFARRLSLTASSVVHSVTSSSLFGSSPPPASSSVYQQPQFYRGSSTILGRGSSNSNSNISSAGATSSSPVAHAASASTSSLPSQRRSRSTSQPSPPPKYRTYRTPQLRISLQDSNGNLVLSPPVMAPGDSIRGQIHLELPKPTPVHSIEVSLTGTVSAYDGARLGVMKSETILEEIKTVATASMTNARTNTTRRHTAPAAPPIAPSSRSAATAGASTADTSTREQRRGSMSNGAAVSPQARLPDPSGNNHQVSHRSSLTSELMSRTLSMPSSHYTHGFNASTHSLNRPVSPTMHDIRGRRTSFSANIDVSGSSPPGLGSGFQLFGRNNMSAVNISTISQWGDPMFDDNTPAYAPSYDSPNFEHLFTGTPPSSSSVLSTAAPMASRQSDEANPTTDAATTSSASSIPEEEESEASSSNMDSSSSATTATTAATSVSSSASSASSTRRSTGRTTTRSNSPSGTNGSSSRGTSGATASAAPATATADTTDPIAPTTAEPEQETSATRVDPTPDVVRQPEPFPEPEPEPEPKAVLMQPGNYVIPFSIRIPSNSVMSLPGSFSDPVGNISYQLKAIMKQIIPPTNDGPRAPPRPIKVEPTYTSAAQVIKLMPMNDPQRMPFYSVPYETPTLKAGVGHWVWSTGFIEARAWIPKQCFRPGRMVPLVIYIVNHSDAKQVVVEATLCKCLHYGSGLTKLREMAEQGLLPGSSTMDWESGFQEDESIQPYTSPSANSFSSPSSPLGNSLASSTPDPNTVVSTNRWGRSRLSLLRSPSRSSRNRNRGNQDTMPSPPASPNANDFSPTTPSSDRSRSPEGSLYGYSSSTMPASPSMGSASMGSLSSQLESLAASSPPTASTLNGKPMGGVTMVLPQVQHQREKLVKLRAAINCHQAIDREIQKTLMVPVPVTAGYSILNAPLLEVSYEIVVKIRVDKVYSRGIRLEVPIVVVVPEEGDMEEEEGLMLGVGVDYQAMLSMTDLHGGTTGGSYGGNYVTGRGRSGTSTSGELSTSFDTSTRYGFSIDDDYGECPPYEPPPVSSGRRRSRR
ncbi:Arrestin domain-containing protein 3 [Actinomortierella ambigua]|nr:Arrestin domain-containing protein 3 [Actinomortierella ambigua]